MVRFDLGKKNFGMVYKIFSDGVDKTHIFKDFTVRMNIDGICYILTLRPEKPGSVFIKEAFEIRNASGTEKLVPLSDGSLLFSLLVLYLKKPRR